tara:strand:- start:146 stop:256 length:111 start_codon:yes stop_codon:yes gene_type:complete
MKINRPSTWEILGLSGQLIVIIAGLIILYIVAQIAL